MSDTPRTDAAAIRCACSSYVVPTEFAHALERETVSLRDELDALQHTLRGMEVKEEQLERENAALLKRLEASDGWDDYSSIKLLQRENAALRAERLELMEQFAQELSVTDFEKRPWLTESAGSTLCADMLKQLAEAGRFRIVRDEDTWVQGYWTKNDQQKKEVK